jgi:hypothetical protein
MTARRRDAAKVGTFARRVVARKRGPFGDAPRTRSLEEWCGQGRTRPHSMNSDRVALRPLRPKLAPAGSGRTAKTRTRPVATRGWPAPLSHPHKWGPCSGLRRPLLHVAPAATQQPPDLTQPDNMSSLSRDRAIWAARRNVEQGPRLRGCDREGVHKNAMTRRAASRSGVASIGQGRWNLLRPPRARCVGSSLCRPATRRPRRLALDPNRLGRARET